MSSDVRRRRPGVAARTRGLLLCTLLALGAGAPLAATLQPAAGAPVARSEETGDAHAAKPPSYPRRILVDLGDLVTGPARLDGAGWRRFGLGLAAVGVAAALDDSARTAVQDHRSAGTDRFARAVRPLGQLGAVALVGGAWIAGRASDHATLAAVGKDGVEASLLAAGLLAPVLERVSGRARPDTGEGPRSFHPFSGNISFPSDEVTEAFTVAAVVSAHATRPWVKGIAWSAAGLVGWERMNFDRHWLSDTVAGALVGAGVGEWVVHRHREPRAADAGPGLTWTVAPLGRGAAVVLAW
jgi:membrane-associated phospholipid phosphatase